MRRPPKPFVTEYRGSSRRQKEAADADHPFSLDAPAGGRAGTDERHAITADARATSRTNGTSTRADSARFGATTSEESYEAALRAADALFARTPTMPAQPANGPRTHDPYFRDQHPRARHTSDQQTGDQHRGDQHTRGLDQGPGGAAMAGEPATVAPDDGGTAKSPPSRSGRILQSLEEPPRPAFADREDLAAPKRRGRKPGSKNKPKVPAFPAEPLDASPAPPSWHATSRHGPSSHTSSSHGPSRDADASGNAPTPRNFSSDLSRMTAASFAEAAPDSYAASLFRIPASGASLAKGTAAREVPSPCVPVDGQRFGWVRTKLAPGQRWKRRLPKVIW